MKLANMTNAQLVKACERNDQRQSAICDTMISDGFGHLRPSDMRDNPDCHPLARETLRLFEEYRAIRHEGDQRYGPGLIVMDHLIVSQGKSYRRIKP